MNQPLNLIDLPEITKRFRPPTIDQCRSEAAKIGLPETEADKFFYFYASKAWMVGKNAMKNWHMALSGWLCRWRDRPECQAGFIAGHLTGADKMILQKEFDRVLEKIHSIRSAYGDHQTKTRDDQVLLTKLVTRKKELMAALGVML